MTVAAVKRFEAKQKRPVDGVADAGDVYELRIEVGQDASPGSSGDPVAGDIPAELAPGNKARVTKSGLAIAPENAPIAVQKIIAAGNKIARKPYLWGGGHGKWEDSGYDCSGSVSYALRGANLMKSPAPSYGFYGYGKAGKGEWVTIYTNAGHMYMTVAGLRFDTSGRGNSGSRWQTEMRSSSGFKIRHPSGL
jgi:cell wall-associated NlpC family hydrolase